MNKKYRIKSKFRFILFMVIVFLIFMTAISGLLGLNIASSSSMNEYNQVQVEFGDTIWEIASKAAPKDMDVREVVYDICQLNDMTADQLVEGDRILIPIYN